MSLRGRRRKGSRPTKTYHITEISPWRKKLQGLFEDFGSALQDAYSQDVVKDSLTELEQENIDFIVDHVRLTHNRLQSDLNELKAILNKKTADDKYPQMREANYRNYLNAVQTQRVEPKDYEDAATSSKKRKNLKLASEDESGGELSNDSPAATTPTASTDATNPFKNFSKKNSSSASFGEASELKILPSNATRNKKMKPAVASVVRSDDRLLSSSKRQVKEGPSPLSAGSARPGGTDELAAPRSAISRTRTKRYLYRLRLGGTDERQTLREGVSPKRTRRECNNKKHYAKGEQGNRVEEVGDEDHNPAPEVGSDKSEGIGEKHNFDKKDGDNEEDEKCKDGGEKPDDGEGFKGDDDSEAPSDFGGMDEDEEGDDSEAPSDFGGMDEDEEGDDSEAPSDFGGMDEDS